ncbi:hypothetical protein [Tsukamurella sp. NPDC003166]|uniref:hypothetical protein n=1 Tax=Tsukamurella sp. NPDC003166 TaxID=3154444 RepID=UPI0033BC300B
MSATPARQLAGDPAAAKSAANEHLRLVLLCQREVRSTDEVLSRFWSILSPAFESLEECTRTAERCFHAGAYSAFWQAIEESGVHLSLITDNLDGFQFAIHARARMDRRLATELNEPTTESPVSMAMVSDIAIGARSASDRIDRLVARAQTDFKFAAIYEQRRANAILIAGFNDLGAAIHSLSDTLSSKLDEVIRSIDGASYRADLASNRASERSLEANMMLDNIQHRQPR